MLTQLSTVKARLNISAADTTQDALLTNAIKAVSARFDRLCNRAFARAENGTHAFPASDVHIVVPCYPIETVTKWETKRSEAEGWIEQAGVDFLIRGSCVLSLSAPLTRFNSQMARVTYTGGFVLPGNVPDAGQAALPADVEHAATEQVAAWYQTRDKLGLIRHWPSGGAYLVLSQLPLLPAVTMILRKYERWVW